MSNNPLPKGIGAGVGANTYGATEQQANISGGADFHNSSEYTPMAFGTENNGFSPESQNNGFGNFNQDNGFGNFNNFESSNENNGFSNQENVDFSQNNQTGGNPFAADSQDQRQSLPVNAATLEESPKKSNKLIKAAIILGAVATIGSGAYLGLTKMNKPKQNQVIEQEIESEQSASDVNNEVINASDVLPSIDDLNNIASDVQLNPQSLIGETASMVNTAASMVKEAASEVVKAQTESKVDEKQVASEPSKVEKDKTNQMEVEKASTKNETNHITQDIENKQQIDNVQSTQDIQVNNLQPQSDAVNPVQINNPQTQVDVVPQTTDNSIVQPSVVYPPKKSYEASIRQKKQEAERLSQEVKALEAERNELEQRLFGKSPEQQIEILKAEVNALKRKKRNMRVYGSKLKSDTPNYAKSKKVNNVKQGKNTNKTNTVKTNNKVNKVVKTNKVVKQSKSQNSMPYGVYAASTGVVVLKTGKGVSQSYVVGDTLPNGARINDIDYFGKKMKTSKGTYNWN